MSAKHGILNRSFVLILIGIAASTTFASDESPSFTPEEQEWIKSHPEIRLIINVGPPPINFWEGAEQPRQQPEETSSYPPELSENGSLPTGSDKPLRPIQPGQQKQFKGIAAEYLQEISDITGIRFTPVLLSYNNFDAAFKALQAGEADLLPMVLGGQPLPKNILVTEPYTNVPLVVIMSENSAGYKKLYELYNLRVAGVPSIRQNLNRIGFNVKLIHTQVHIGLLGVASGTYDAFIGELSSISYELAQDPVTGIKIAGELPRPSHAAMAVSPRIQAFVPIFNKALTLVSRDRKTAIHEKWFKTNYVHTPASGRMFWAGLIIAACVLVFGLLYYKRRLRLIQTAADVLDPHLLSAVIDHNTIITKVSEALCDSTGYTTGELIGKPLLALGNPATAPSDSSDFFLQKLKENSSWKGEVKIRKKDGSTLWAETVIAPLRREGEGGRGYTVIFQDVSQKKHFETLAIKDELTMLYNRRHFAALAPRLLQHGKQENKILAFILMDLDSFKKYNDTYGHPAGDKVLASIGNTLNSIFKRREDLAFRLGGDEFAAIALVGHAEDATAAAERIRRQVLDLNITHRPNPQGVVTMSIGLALLNPDDSSDMDTLYKKADSALYQAKQKGGDQFFCSETRP